MKPSSSKAETQKPSSFLSGGIGRSLLLRFLLISIVPMAFIAWESIQINVKAIKKNQIDTLTVLAHATHSHLSDYINTSITNLRLQAELDNTVHFLEALKSGFLQSGKPLDKFTRSYQWASLEDQYGADLSRFLTTYSYIDILLLDDLGNILYSIRRDSDLGSNLFNGELDHSKLAKAAKRALDTGTPTYSDIEPYLPYNHEIAGFITQAVVGEYGDKLGLLVIHLEQAAIEKIIRSTTGLEHKSEAFIVGGDLLLRTNSVLPDRKTVLKTRVDTPATQSWFRQLHQATAAGVQVTDETATADNTSYINHHGVSVFGFNLAIEFAGVPLLIVTEVSETEALAPLAVLKSRMLFILLFAVGLVVVMAVYSARAITRPISELTVWARQLTTGHLISRHINAPNNEIGVLNQTFVELVESLRQVIGVMEALSVGDLSQSLNARSDRDVLVQTLNYLSQTMQSIVSQAELIAVGDYNGKIKPRSDKDLLGNALSLMIGNLRQAAEQNAQQNWIKTSQAELSQIISGDKELLTLSDQVAGYLARQLGALVAAIYVTDYPEREDVLVLTGGYALGDGAKASLHFGEGLVGQAAQEQTLILVDDLPDNYLFINSSLGQAAPSTALIVPFVHNNKVNAVIEIAGFRAVSEKNMAFIKLIGEPVAVAFYSCFTRDQTAKLLLETQQQSEELQSQQEELRVTNENLKANSDALELQQQVLEKAQIETLEKALALEEASKYKSEFLANMSHELRTPLNSLLILARSLSENDEGNLSADEVESAEVILDSGRHLLELINDVLDLSKIEAGQMILRTDAVEIAGLAAAMDRRFNHMAADKGIGFKIQLDENLPATIKTDSVKINQILTNLISNGIKFTDTGDVCLKVSIRVGRGSQNGEAQTIIFDIIDSGIGIAKDKHTAIFGAFQQADGSTSRTHGGTGLGLSIVKSLAHLLGGDIALDSTPGKGSTFSFYLPQKPQGSNSQSRLALMGDVQSADKRQVRNKHTPPPFADDRGCLDAHKTLLLIVEDDPKFAKILFNACHKQHCQAIVAPDGETGLTLTHEYDFKGVVLDYMLPGLDGGEILAQIKSDPQTRHLPVHVISALDNLGDMCELGATGQAIKPVTGAELIAIIQAFSPALVVNGQDSKRDGGQGDEKVLNLLIVEDDISALFAVKKLLQDEKIHNTGVRSGKAAIQQLRLNPFDVIILDLELPDISGFELLDSIAADPLIRLPQIIVYSGKDINDEMQLRLAPYTGIVIIKSAYSAQRLLDEVHLFASRVADSSTTVSTLQAQIEIADSSGSNDFADHTLLLVDDDMRNTFALAKVLRKYQLNVRLASSGQQCLAMLSEHDDIELVLMDIMMPQMDGYETMGHIRKQVQFKNLPLIAVTANAMPEDKEKCLNAGANDYLPKPVDIGQLLTMLRLWLK